MGFILLDIVTINCCSNVGFTAGRFDGLKKEFSVDGMYHSLTEEGKFFLNLFQHFFLKVVYVPHSGCEASTDCIVNINRFLLVFNVS